MRSTRAAAAVERLKKRTGNPLYSLSLRSDGLFVLRLASPGGPSEAQGTPLPMEDFVRFVDGLGPQAPKRVSKLDTAFRQQLKKPQPD